MSLRPAGTSDLPDNLKYSKWDHIEVSDDEGDSHPNIDQKLMARLKKEKRQRDYEEFRSAFVVPFFAAVVSNSSKYSQRLHTAANAV